MNASAIDELFAAHLLHLVEEIDLAARYALIDLRERCLYHRRGLGQVGRYLFEVEKKQ